MIYEHDTPISIYLLKIKEINDTQIKLEKNHYIIKAKSLSLSKHIVDNSTVGKGFWENGNGITEYGKAKHLIDYKKIIKNDEKVIKYYFEIKNKEKTTKSIIKWIFKNYLFVKY